MILDIVNYGHPALRTKGTKIGKVTAELRKLAEDMLDTMYEASGVGLAAQQVAKTIQICVIDICGATRPSRLFFSGIEVNPEDYMPMVLINPVLTLEGVLVAENEGCLSFPELGGRIPRPERVKVEALNLKGEKLTFLAEGFLARAVQHESDHLNGVLFIDRMVSTDKAKIEKEYKAIYRATRKSLEIQAKKSS
ncbi:MAG: peptide deformylase [Verrucomicrobiota bacterium]|nr:peptide deformylase [Verrucomicrobiota bacterium]